MSEARKRGSVLATEHGIEILKKAQTEKRWTQKVLAKRASISERTIRRFFRRQQPVDESYARIICQVLGVEFADVIDVNTSSKQADRAANITVEDQHHMDQWIHLDEYLVSELSSSSTLKPEVINFCQKWLDTSWHNKLNSKFLLLTELEQDYSQKIQRLFDVISSENSDIQDSIFRNEELFIWKGLELDSPSLYYNECLILVRSVDKCLEALDKAFGVDTTGDEYKSSDEFYATYSKWFSPAFVNSECWENFKAFQGARHSTLFVNEYTDVFKDFIANVILWSVREQADYLRLNYKDGCKYFNRIALGYIGTIKHVVEAKLGAYVSRELFLRAFYDWAVDRGLNPQISFNRKLDISQASLRIL